MGQIVQLPLVAGIEEGVDPKALPPGKLLVGVNCKQDKEGRVRKRDGTVLGTRLLLSGGNVPAGERIVTRGEDLGVYDGANVHSYSGVMSKWQTIDQPSPLMTVQRPLLDTIRSAELVDQVVHEGLIVTVFLAGYSISEAPLYVMVREAVTGTVVLPPTLVAAAGMNPRVVVYPTTDTAYVLWSTSGGSIGTRALSLATLALASEVLLPSTYVASSLFDAQIAGAYLLVVGVLGSGSNRVRLRKFDLSDATLTTYTTTDSGGSVTVGAICLDASDGSNVFVAYSTDALTRIITYDLSTIAVGAGPSTVYSGVSTYVWVVSHSPTQTLYGHCPGTAGNPSESFTTFLLDVSHSVVSGTRRRSHQLFSPSKPWRINGRWYCRALTLLHSYALADTVAVPDPSTVIIEIRTDAYTAAVPVHRHVATLENQTSWYSYLVSGHLTQPAVSGETVYIATVYRNREPTNFDVTPLGWNEHTLTIGGGDAHRLLPVGRAGISVAAAPYVFDGATASPAGFVHAPMFLTANAGSSATGNMAAGDYQFVATYAWRDTRGVLHRSIPSPPVLVANVPSTGSVNLRVACTSISAKQSEVTGFGANSASPVMIELWRTLVDGGDFYRRTHEPLHGVIFNDPTADSVTFADTKGDADIAGGSPAVPLATQPQLYTVSELEDVPPPAFTTATVHRGRFAGLAADRRTLWMSKDVNEDPSVFPGFHEALTLGFAEDKYALRSLDERLIVFGDGNISMVEGDGPDSSGDQNTWRVVSLQTDSGCTNPRSIVAIPIGLMFQSNEDILLLERGLTVGWIGRAVVDRLAAYPVITSATLVTAEHEVRFTCNAANGATGIVLVYDYERNAWYERKYYDVVSSTANMPIADAAMIDGVYTMLLATGYVYRETSSHCLDNGVRYVEMAVEMFVAPAGNQGWSRLKDIQVLGTGLSDHDLTISVARDFATSFEQTETFTVLDEPVLEDRRMTVAIQKGQAFRVRVADSTPTGGNLGNGQGFILEGLALNVVPKTGLPRIPASKRG